jgi:hypothetical protein
MAAATVKKKWEKLARSSRLVRTEILGTVSKTTKGANWKRSDGLKGTARSEKAAKRLVEGSAAAAMPLPPKAKTKRGAKPAPAPARLELNAANLLAVADALPASAKYHHRNVFLWPLLQRFGLTPQEAKSALIKMHQNEEITLTRADLVEAMDPELVRRSEISHSGARFHFLTVES